MPNLGTARAQRFHAYVERLSTALGHRDRHGPLRAYVTGLCLPGERKSIEPMAARVDPRHVRARHQSMHHFVANAAWDDGAVLRAARETVLAALERHGPVAAWVVDDTGMPKKGRHSVGVARQYCGVLGKQDNCQVAVSLSLAHERASVPVAYRLYLPETWAQDRRRRRAAGVPDAIEFRTKWQIALEQVAQIAAEGVPAAPVVADAGYGVVTAFRDALTAQAIPYVVGISTETTVWASGPRIATTGARHPGSKSGCSSNGRGGKLRRSSIGSPRCHRRRPRSTWSAWRCCAGASSGTTKSSRTSWGWITSKAGAGAASIITPRSASRRTHSSPPSGSRISPLSLSPSSRPLAYPNVSSRGALPVRPERHAPDSIATMYRLLAWALARGRPCLACGHQPDTNLVTQ